MRQKFLLCIGLLFALFLIGCQHTSVAEDARPILENLLEQADRIPKTREQEVLVAAYRSLLETDASSQDIWAAAEAVKLLNQEMLKTPVLFVDGALEQKVRNTLGFSAEQQITVRDTMTLKVLDASAKDGDASVRVTYDLKYFPALVSLNLSGNQLTELSGLLYLHFLEMLDLSYTVSAERNENLKAVSFELLGQIDSLKQLSLAGNEIAEAAYLPVIPGLQVLDLSDNPLTDTGFVLSYASTLTELNLSGTDVCDLSSLACCTQLQVLDLSQTKISSVEPLAALTTLRSLNLSGNELTDVSYLRNLVYLEHLMLSGTRISDLTFLADLQALKTLDCSETCVLDFSVLPPLAVLQELNISGNAVASFSLVPFPSLQIFRAEGCGLTELNLGSVLITELYLQENYLASFPSSGLQTLQVLDLSGNRLKSATFDASFSSLVTLNLNGNPLESVNISLPALLQLGISDAVLSTLDGVQADALVALDVLNCPVQNLSFVTSFPCLSSLRVNLSEVTDFSPLNMLSGLQHLTLHGLKDFSLLDRNCLLEVEELVFDQCKFASVSLYDFPALETLVFSDCLALSDLSGLVGLVGLRQLTVQGCSIAQPLISGFPALERLSLIDCGVLSTELISDLPQLKELCFAKNDLREVRLSEFPLLMTLDISGNQLKYIDNITCSMTSGRIILTGNPIKEYSGVLFEGVELVY